MLNKLMRKWRPTDTYVNYVDIYRDRALARLGISRPRERYREGNEVTKARI